MFVFIFLLILFSTFFLLLNIKLRFFYWSRRNLISYPSSFPFGSIENFFKKEFTVVGVQFKKFYNYFKAQNQPHGGVYILSNPIYVPIDPAILKHIFVKDFQFFSSKGLYMNERDQPVNGNIFQLGGQRWRNLRNKLSPTFTSGKLKVMFPTVKDCTVPLVAAFKKHAKNGTMVDIKDLTTKYAVNVIGSCAFGIDCGAFEEESAFRHYAIELFKPSKFRRLIRSFLFSWPTLALKFRCIGFEKEHEHFFTKTVHDNAKYREQNDIIRQDFFHLMLEMKKRSIDENFLGMQEIVNQSFMFFLAAFETSSKTMTHALVELAQNSDIQERVRDEIKEMIQKHGGLNYEAVYEMKYLERVVNETLRKYPPVTVCNRECNAPYQVPGTKIVLEPGTKVYIPVYAIHHDPEYYPNPELFDPDRFTEENIAKRPPYTFLPFGEGPRICIGMRFGYVQTKLGLLTLLTKYRFSPHESTKFPLEFKNTVLLLNSVEPINLRCEEVHP